MKHYLAALLLLILTSQTVHAGLIKGTVDGGKRLQKSPAVVYLANVKGDFKPPATNPTMDQRTMTFIPHVLAVQVGTTVDFLNNDEVRHNVFSPNKEKYNLGTWPQGNVKQYTFSQKGAYSQLCNVHPEMEAFVVALDTPYFATTDASGNFEISDIPAGDYTVKVWHEKLKFKKQTLNVPSDGIVEAVFQKRSRKR
jgi:plastocyanin